MNSYDPRHKSPMYLQLVIVIVIVILFEEELPIPLKFTQATFIDIMTNHLSHVSKTNSPKAGSGYFLSLAFRFV